MFLGLQIYHFWGILKSFFLPIERQPWGKNYKETENKRFFSAGVVQNDVVGL